jgi:phosphoenolpyruvate carboxykinase (ATP)
MPISTDRPNKTESYLSQPFSLESHLTALGFKSIPMVQYGLTPAGHVEQAILNHEGMLSNDGALVVHTGCHTGRSPNDKYILQADGTTDIWCGKINQPMLSHTYRYLYDSMLEHLGQHPLYIDDVSVGQDPLYRLGIRMISSQAWYGLFCQNLLIPVSNGKSERFTPEVTILHAPDIIIQPEKAGTRSSTFIVLNLNERVILIGGTAYAGEVKKSVFSLMNYLMPKQKVFPMHCSANVGTKGDVALFFGLSGTGKTTLSSSPDRQLIGDDEHGWSEQGVFNFEGGCYAKTIRLSPKYEPLIWQAIHRFGALIENVVIDPLTREIDFNSDEITENTRAAYPLHFIENHYQKETAGHPTNVFFLTADASGVLPPIARLSPDQALYYFLAGYTSKLAGTEVNLGSQPQATFSTCFAAPFLPLHPMVYAAMLGERIHQHQTHIWLVNTGWSGGMFGTGKRMHLPNTRAMIKAALDGNLDSIPFRREAFFNLEIPEQCPGVPKELLDPQATWQDSAAYAAQARLLSEQFIKTMEQYRHKVPPEVISSGPGAAGSS